MRLRAENQGYSWNRHGVDIDARALWSLTPLFRSAGLEGAEMQAVILPRPPLAPINAPTSREALEREYDLPVGSSQAGYIARAVW